MIYSDCMQTWLKIDYNWLNYSKERNTLNVDSYEEVTRGMEIWIKNDVPLIKWVKMLITQNQRQKIFINGSI